MPRLDDPALAALCESIRHNCAISDARHARDYSLCIYLLRMREFYRWQNDLPLDQSLDTSAVGEWVSEREADWDDIEEHDFAKLTIGDRSYAPFDTDAINRALNPRGLVYSAGLGRFGQPHFLLASLDADARHDGIEYYDCGTEYVRDSITIPAMSQQGCIFIRHDSIQRLLWQMVEEWQLHRQPGAMQRLVQRYRLDAPDPCNSGLLDTAARDLAIVIRAHERGEVLAGRELDDHWSALMQASLGTPVEYLLRSLRDVLADALQTLPTISEREDPGLLDLWMSGLNGVRRQWLDTAGTLAMLDSAPDDSTRLARLKGAQAPLLQLWRDVTHQILSAQRSAGRHDNASIALSASSIEALIEEAIQ